MPTPGIFLSKSYVPAYLFKTDLEIINVTFWSNPSTNNPTSPYRFLNIEKDVS